MPKPLFNVKQNVKDTTFFAEPTTTKKTNNINNVTNLKAILRQKRSPKYMQLMRELDTGGHVHNQEQVKNIIKIIKEEFPFIEIPGMLLGYVSKCFLGKPYEVHIIDLSGEIIEHYKQGQSLPGAFEKARSIALYGNYEFVEVYTDCCRAVSADGSVSVI